MGRLACFSFYPGKNLRAYGERGALVTSDPDLADLARPFRHHGQKTRCVHERLGFNYRGCADLIAHTATTRPETSQVMLRTLLALVITSA
jgi:dTDP-4-amino-4,6-dideoxygalactose transaminase